MFYRNACPVCAHAPPDRQKPEEWIRSQDMANIAVETFVKEGLLVHILNFLTTLIFLILLCTHFLAKFQGRVSLVRQVTVEAKKWYDDHAHCNGQEPRENYDNVQYT